MENNNEIIIDSTHKIGLDDFFYYFPEFIQGDDTEQKRYPDQTILSFIKIGIEFVNIDLWGDNWKWGVCLFAAHELVISINQNENGNATPGLTNGVIASKSVGSVSKSYDTGNACYSDAGYYNLTSYGQRYWIWSKRYGRLLGGLQL